MPIDTVTRGGEVPELPRCRKCGEPFTPKRVNQLYCKPEHRPPPKTLRISEQQADVIRQLAAQLA